jgi:hypothetical protein
MTQNEKDILLKDLCGRLPYGVNCKIYYKYRYYNMKLSGIFDNEAYFTDNNGSLYIDYENVKPYLFPLSSMTEEQKYDFYCRFIENDCDFDDFKEFYLDNGMWHKLLTSLDDIETIIDWLNKNHLDYRGLIPMGLANDATDKNIY